MTRRALASLLGTALAVTVLGASPPSAHADPTPTASISGRVGGPHDDGIGRILVTAFRQTGETWTDVGEDTTEADGRFQITGLDEGTYRLRFADREGMHAPEYWNDAPSLETADDIPVAPDAAITDKDAVLAELGQIRGVVTDTDGDPIENAVVIVHQGWDAEMREPLEEMAASFTDARGRYSLEGFYPGEYRVEFRRPSYENEFWPDAPDASSAGIIEIGPGDRLVRSAALRPGGAEIRGMLRDGTGAGVSGLIHLYRQTVDGGFAPHLRKFNMIFPDSPSPGAFDFSDLPAGTYRLGFRTYGPGGWAPEYYGDVLTLVESPDVALSRDGSVQLDDVVVTTAGPLLASTSPPAVLGTPQVGQPLNAAPGAWNRTGVTPLYQWQVGGTAVPGATGPTYVPVDGDLGKGVTVSVTGVRPPYASVTVISAATAPVAAAPTAPTTPTITAVRNVALPRITGKARVGQRLTATPGTWAPSRVTLRYQWYAGGKAIRGAKAKTLRSTRKQQGKRITVRVTATAPGHSATAVRSKPTVKVRRR